MRVAIIGGGPAGAMAAARLARGGATVLLFDHSHPREKPCGGGLTARAIALVDDLVDLHTLPAVTIRSAIVEPPANLDAPEAVQYPGSRSARVDLIARGPGAESSLVVISRAVFDRALVRAAVVAGSTFIAEKVKAISRERGKLRVLTRSATYMADFVIGADGANSLVRKTFSRPFNRSQISVAGGCFVHGATSSDIVIKCVREQPGYLWSFPRPDHLALGVCAPADTRVSSSRLQQQSLAWLRRKGIDSGHRLDWYGWPIPSVTARDSSGAPLAGEGWMLLGDAAGLVDPLTREGIYYALQSGHWAREALAAGVARAPRTYTERVSDQVYPELDRAAQLSTIFFSCRFAPLFVKALIQSEAIRNVFRDLIAGVQPYKGLRRRLLATREWKLAGEAARTVVQLASLFQGETQIH
jgi:geranylgeranyl reductase family protein